MGKKNYSYKALYLAHYHGIIPFFYPSTTPPPSTESELTNLLDEFRTWSQRLGRDIAYPKEIIQALSDEQIDDLLNDTENDPVGYFFLDAKEVKGEKFFDKEELTEFRLIGANGLMYLFSDPEYKGFVVAQGMRGIKEMFERIKPPSNTPLP